MALLWFSDASHGGGWEEEEREEPELLLFRAAGAHCAQ